MLSLILKRYFSHARKPLIAWNFYFYLINLPIFWLLGCRYFLNSGLPHGGVALLFTITAIIGQFAILSLLFCFLISFILGLIIPNKPLVMTVALIGTLLSIFYLTVDSTVFLTYRFHLNGVILQMIFSSAFSQIFDFSWIEWSLAVIFVLLIIALEIFLVFWIWRKTARIKKVRYYVIAFGFIILCYILSQLIHAWCSAAYMYQGANYAQSAISASEKFPMYYGLTAKNFLLGDGHNGFIKPKANNNISFSKLSSNDQPSDLNYPLHAIKAQAKKNKLNVMLIVLDTWRADMMTQSTSPHIYKFAQKAWQFTDHYSGGDCTEPGIFSLFYGIPASYWSSALDAQHGPVLIDQLLSEHYQLAIYASASLYKPDFYHSVFVNVPNLHINNPQPNPWQRDQYINQEMLKFLKDRNTHKPFFGFLFYDSIHEYDFPPNFKTKFNPWWKTIDHLALTNTFNPLEYENRYKNSVVYVDGLVNQILIALKQQGLMKNTVIIITADHGEEFNDNHKDYWGHASNFSSVQMKTPFIVYWPGRAPKTYTHFTTHYDVVPLIMKNVLGVTNPTRDYTIGQPLLTPGNRGIIPVSSYVFNGFVEHNNDRITTLLGAGLYRVTNDKLNPVTSNHENIAHLQMIFEMMHRYYK